jgi:hypothetical protein
MSGCHIVSLLPYSASRGRSDYTADKAGSVNITSMPLLALRHHAAPVVTRPQQTCGVAQQIGGYARVASIPTTRRRPVIPLLVRRKA